MSIHLPAISTSITIREDIPKLCPAKTRARPFWNAHWQANFTYVCDRLFGNPIFHEFDSLQAASPVDVSNDQMTCLQCSQALLEIRPRTSG